jgi:metal-responsive CopG/Arc/MetJ family transcriptional regulator
MSPGVVTPKEKVEYAPQTSVRMTKALLAQVDAIARETGRSRNAAIIQLLEFAVEEHLKGGKKPRK